MNEQEDLAFLEDIAQRIGRKKEVVDAEIKEMQERVIELQREKCALETLAKEYNGKIQAEKLKRRANNELF